MIRIGNIEYADEYAWCEGCNAIVETDNPWIFTWRFLKLEPTNSLVRIYSGLCSKCGKKGINGEHNHGKK